MKVLYITNYNKEQILEKPDNFAYYTKSMMDNEHIDLCLLAPSLFIQRNPIYRTISILKAIRKAKPHILYIDNLTGLNKLVLFKRIGILKCKIVIWKYTYCKESKNSIYNWVFKHLYWKGIDRVYMVSDSHAHHAVSHGILNSGQIVTLSRGADTEWYQQYTKLVKDDFLVMATGKDSRDYHTLSEACEQTHTHCLIITRRHESNVKVAETYVQSQYVKFVFIEDLHLKDEYEYIMAELGRASILAIPCEKRNYGVGYTNVVEALPYCIPILLTYNPDIPIDIEKEGIGYLIKPYDVETWKEKIIQIRQHPEIVEEMSMKVKELLKEKYNAKTTATFIVNDFIRIMTKK